jgi:predicted RNA-binding Zn-ribbon protein involved in translation (DUF1610 family)
MGEIINAFCDKGCKEIFTLDVEEGIKTENIIADVEKVYFICPNCGCEYLIYYLNNEIKKLQRRQRKLLKMGSEVQVKLMQKKIKNEMDKLKKKMSKIVEN